MKKIFGGILAAAVLSLSVNAFAANFTISISNNETDTKPVTYTYSANQEGEKIQSIKNLITDLSDIAKKKTITQELTVTAEGEENAVAELTLRLSPEGDTAKTEPAVLDYYTINITDENGDVVYANKSADKYENGYRDIPMGTVENKDEKNSRKYVIEISINDGTGKTSLQKAAADLDWSVVTEAKNVISVTVSPSAAPAARPAATADSSGIISLNAGEYVCGTDIASGRYTITGSGKVNVYLQNGTLKSTIALKNKGDNANGVEEYIINLLDGERIVSDGNIKLQKYAEPKATATPKPTKTPAAKATATPKAAAAANKTNPKTGDTAPIILVTAIGILSIAAVIYIELRKRNEY